MVHYRFQLFVRGTVMYTYSLSYHALRSQTMLFPLFIKTKNPNAITSIRVKMDYILAKVNYNSYGREKLSNDNYQLLLSDAQFLHNKKKWLVVSIMPSIHLSTHVRCAALWHEIPMNTKTCSPAYYKSSQRAYTPILIFYRRLLQQLCSTS